MIMKLLKLLTSGITAVAILSIIVIPYSLSPLHYDNPYHNTDYIWEPNSVWITMREGIAWGKYDSAGYNNLKVIDNPDVVLLGSSHLQGKSVVQRENVGTLLSDMLDGQYTVYNMGIAGHNFFKVCQYLPNNLTLKNHTPRIVVIETSTVELSEKEVENVLNGSIEKTPSYTSGMMAFLQRIPFIRLLYAQLDEGLMDLFLSENVNNNAAEAQKPGPDYEKEIYDRLFSYFAELIDRTGAKLIIVYHPRDYQLNKDGGLSFKRTNDSLELFSAAAEEYGIRFIDLTNRFLDEYEIHHRLPHGFITGKIGSGHLNRLGHRIMAEELCKTITEMEAK